MHPWGGRAPLVGTNPIAVALPTDGEPFLLGMATGAISRGEVIARRLRGEELPPGCAIDEHDRATVDPAAAERGAISPFGGAKGFALGLALELLAAQRGEPEARAALAYGSLCAGLAFGVAGTSLAHALQCPLGARTHTPHGLGTGLLLACATRFNLPARRAELAAIGRAMGVAGPTEEPERAAWAAIRSVAELAVALGLPPSLAALGIEEEELPSLARQALTVRRLTVNNPRPVTERDLTELLRAPWRGELDDAAAPARSRPSRPAPPP